jgi:1,4-dihydroxy-2-naphthoate octaprenyltransferase
MSESAALRVWWATTRPKTLPAAAAPVLLGTALAAQAGGFHAPSALAALAFALLIQIGTNFANDYFDHRQGGDTASRQGPRRALHLGQVSLRGMGWATTAVFTAAAGVGGVLLWRAGMAFAVVIALSILCGIFYTAGRKSLAYLGIADLFVVIFFGPVAVAGTHYAQTLRFDWTPILLGLSPGLIATGLLAINNLRDVEEDRGSGKRTPAVRFGRAFVRWEYTLALFIAALLPALLVWTGRLPAPTLLASLTWLAALPTVRGVWRHTEGAQLNPLLGATGRLLLLFVALVATGLWWR